MEDPPKELPRCDVCGATELAGENFSLEERLFRRARRFCPACLNKHDTRVALLWALFPVVVTIWALYGFFQYQRPLLQSPAMWIALLLVFQWIMVVPHELGHALSARWLGYSNIRILIGSGRALAAFQFLGFRWLWNPIPLGGVTLAEVTVDSRLRAKEFVMTAAGPAVNAVAALLTWWWIEPGALWTGQWSVLQIFFWANIVVLVENLIPSADQTPFGAARSDGAVLWSTLFEWRRPDADGSREAGKWRRIINHGRKWAFVAVMYGAAAICALVAVFVVWRWSDLPAPARIVLALVWLWLMWSSAKSAYRAQREPTDREFEPVPVNPAQRGIEELMAASAWGKDAREGPQIDNALAANDPDGAAHWIRIALERYPNDVLLLVKKANELVLRENFAAAEETYAQVMADYPDTSSAAYLQLVQARLECVLQQGDSERAEQLCADYLAGPASVKEQVQLLDALASVTLYQNKTAFFERAEGWARKALELAPGALTLKGTLGGVLVELGRLEEGEALLRECQTASTAVHDQGIAALYLGVIESKRGNAKKARQWIKRATMTFPQPWILERSARLAAEMEEP